MAQLDSLEKRTAGVWVNMNHPSAPRPAPPSQVGIVGWLRANLFNGIGNTLLTLGALWLVYTVVTRLVGWVVNDAFWTPVWVNRKLLTVGTYPWDRIWQPATLLLIISLLFGLSAGRWRGFMRTVGIGLASLLIALALLPLDPTARLILGLGAASILGGYLAGRLTAIPNRLLAALWILILPLGIILLRGGLLLPFMGTVWTLPGGILPYSAIGGLTMTILLAVVGICLSFPFGVLLALGRRSRLPVVKYLSIGYIELIRGVPLISLLFMASIALPLVLPAFSKAPENAVRAMVAISAFEAAYLAETVRGGLQAVPKGQYEAADALGLGAVTKLRTIILPQALRAVIPALVGQFISLFKDTSLVTLISLYELLGIATVVIQQPDWITIQGGITREVYVFVACVYFIFSYGMSYASKRLEVQLGVGKR